jgi:tetratricopeptide (TPR) repeat protein
MSDVDIEVALEDAVEEMILIEHIDEDDGDRSLKSGSTGTGDSATRSRDGARTVERYFQFSHAMWRENVLKTMLKDRTTAIHRRIAESMEKEASLLEQSDISRLLTLFYHWKSCGDFVNSARLSLAVGERLVDYELYEQAMDLFEEALVLAYEAVARVESELDNVDWMQVSSKPEVLDYILRLHIRLGLCHQSLGDEAESIQMFEDAYNIMKTSSRVPARSTSLMMPIISSLCVLKLNTIAKDTRTRLEHEKLVEKFVKEAVANGSCVHIGRALAMEAGYYATRNQLERAISTFEKLRSQYDFKANSRGMIQEYSREFALECCSEAVLWNYVLERHDEALQLADLVINDYLPLLEECEADVAMYAVFPLVQVLKLIGRARDAKVILKDFVVRPYQEGSPAEFWEPIFNPLAYLLDLIAMEDNEEYDEQLLDEIEAYALDDGNHEYFSRELEPKAKTVLGEICWRLVDFKDKNDPSRRVLKRKARELLTPIAANNAQTDVFLGYTAQALVEAL